MSAVSITDELPQLVGQDLAETPLELLPQLRGWVEGLGLRVLGLGKLIIIMMMILIRIIS